VVKDITASLRMEWFDPVMVKGLPQEDDLLRLDSLAEGLAKRIKEN
jgi:hypothetical protein